MGTRPCPHTGAPWGPNFLRVPYSLAWSLAAPSCHLSPRGGTVSSLLRMGRLMHSALFTLCYAAVRASSQTQRQLMSFLLEVKVYQSKLINDKNKISSLDILQAVGILHDVRRLNVAVTRAMHKLIIIGSRTALVSLKPFHHLLSIISEQQIINLPAKS